MLNDNRHKTAVMMKTLLTTKYCHSRIINYLDIIHRYNFGLEDVSKAGVRFQSFTGKIRP
jgi:hypothetical protein